ncbi:MAG: peptidoglycan DD-metalloendopeptidase family protein [Clostridia bacterium]|jgi:murein DD-endopeptidase MepM/ murein hydrolase activator NlpD|nr:peptidoglycan DD-metalloendopeptidase family protein [Clostridia bacterium]
MRKILCIVLILLICFITTFVQAENKEENNSTDIYTQRNELQNQLNEANGELEGVKSELSENLQQVEKLDKKIETAEAQLEEYESKITNFKNSINKIETELNTVSDKYEKQKELLKKRLVATYVAGETQYLDILLKSRSIDDFLSSYYLISQLAEIDNNLMKELEGKKKTIDLSRQKLEKEKKELAVIAETQTRTARTLQNTKKLRESFIEKLSEEEQQLQNKIDEINTQYEIINKQILAAAMEGLDTQYIGGELAWPVPGYTRITSNYGMRVHPITHQYKLHTGVDIGAPEGANFIAANDGIVVRSEMNIAYGNMVIIDHGGGISTLYAHGSEILVQVGQTVKRGEPILKVGSTGYSTGPHAHFEVRINGITVNPLPYITNGLVPGTEENINENTNSIE